MYSLILGLEAQSDPDPHNKELYRVQYIGR